MSAQAKELWQTAKIRPAGDSQRHFLLVADWLRVAVFAKRLPGLAERLPLFQDVAKVRNVETTEQASAPLMTKESRETGAKFGGLSRQPIGQNLIGSPLCGWI